MSSTGGASWAKLADIPWSGCHGGPTRFGRVTDPWVSYDAGGNLYFIGHPIDSAALGISAISVSTWSGTSWSAPQILIEDRGDRGTTNDKVSITGDPTRAGYPYATWIRFSHPAGERNSENPDFHSYAFRGVPMISRTSDAAGTWSAAEPMRRTNTYLQGNQIAVAPGGTLYDVAANLFTGAGIGPGGVYQGIMRSTDAGLHWSAPSKIAPIRTTQLFVPDDNFPIRAGDYLPDIAIDPSNGDIYVILADGTGTALDKIVMEVDRRRAPLDGPDGRLDGRPAIAGVQPCGRGHGRRHGRPHVLRRSQPRPRGWGRHDGRLAAPLARRMGQLGA